MCCTILSIFIVTLPWKARHRRRRFSTRSPLFHASPAPVHRMALICCEIRRHLWRYSPGRGPRLLRRRLPNRVCVVVGGVRAPTQRTPSRREGPQRLIDMGGQIGLRLGGPCGNDHLAVYRVTSNVAFSKLIFFLECSVLRLVFGGHMQFSVYSIFFCTSP